MPRPNNDQYDFTGMRKIADGLAKKFGRIFHWLGDERGTRNEKNFFFALMKLQQMNVPIMFYYTEKNSLKDRQGIDIILYGTNPLYLERIGIDVKSSEKGVEQYLERKRFLEETKGIQRLARYPYYVPDGEGDASLQFLKNLVIFILEKSQSHAHKAWILKTFNPAREDEKAWDEFRSLIEQIFYEESVELDTE